MYPVGLRVYFSGPCCLYMIGKLGVGGRGSELVSFREFPKLLRCSFPEL